MRSRRPSRWGKPEVGRVRGKPEGRGGATRRTTAEVESLTRTGTRAAVDPELQGWIRDVIVPGLVDVYCGQVKRARGKPTEPPCFFKQDIAESTREAKR
jgi:hypothetical protein